MENHEVMMRSYMPRGPNVAIGLCIVSYAEQNPSYFCMRIMKCMEKVTTRSIPMTPWSSG